MGRILKLVSVAYYTLQVNHYYITDTQRKELLCNSAARSSRTVYDESHILEALAGHLCRVKHCRRSHHSRTVLIIVENRYIKLFFEPALYLKAAWSGNVLKINTAEAVGYQLYCADNFVRIL